MALSQITPGESGQIAWVVVLNKQLCLSFGKIVTLLQPFYGLSLTRSGLVHAVRRAARQAPPTYEALCAQVRGSPMVSPDETGGKVAGVLQWLWAFATPTTTVYAIQPGRGFDEAAAVLGAEFAGILVRDGWAPYRQFTEAAHQTCLAYLLRRCRVVTADHPRSPFWRGRSSHLAAGLGGARSVCRRHDLRARGGRGPRPPHDAARGPPRAPEHCARGAALRAPPLARVFGDLVVPVRSVDRCHELARRARDPAGRRDA